MDRHVGARMRERRIMLGLTQQQMAELIGVTYQQAHKYEKGINRIAGGRLYAIAQALGVEVGYFYEGHIRGLGILPCMSFSPCRAKMTYIKKKSTLLPQATSAFAQT